VPALAAFAAALPPVPRERASVDVAALPPALRPLARYFGGWTEGDDEARSAYQRRAGPRRRAKLLAAVGPQVGEIDEYLTASAMRRGRRRAAPPAPRRSGGRTPRG
jgi:hypothetical protein